MRIDTILVEIESKKITNCSVYVGVGAVVEVGAGVEFGVGLDFSGPES